MKKTLLLVLLLVAAPGARAQKSYPPGAGGGGGTVTSVATSSPIGGGTITGSGTITCTTCVVGANNSTTSSATPTPAVTVNGGTMYVLTAQAAGATFGAPTGSPNNGDTLTIRIKDNGSAQALSWNSAYRASSDLALPTTTVSSKTMYLSFVWNSTDSKWDFVALLGNF